MNFFVKWLVVIMTTVPCENQGVWDEVTQSYSETQFTTLACHQLDTLNHEKHFTDSLQAIQFFERITKDNRVIGANVIEYKHETIDTLLIDGKILLSPPNGGCFPKPPDTLRKH